MTISNLIAALPRSRLHMRRNAGRYAAGTAVAITGLILTVASSAATFNTHTETESGALSRSGMVVTDASASGGQSVIFSTAQGSVDSSFLSMGHDTYNFVSGAGKTINGITLRLTAGGDFQVVNNSGTILWHTNTSANCSAAASCRVVLQSDGNLVLYGPGNTALWGSNTFNVNGPTLIFQPRESYLTIRNADYEVVWTSNGTNSTGATAMLNGALTTPRAPSVRSFLDSLAVNTHMDQYEGDAAKLLDKLNYLGVHAIRDHYAENGSLLSQYTFLAQHGIRFDMLHYSSDLGVVLQAAETMAGLANKPLIAVEGPNEINNFPFTCNGSTWQGGWPNPNGPAAQCFMQGLFGRIHGDSKLAGVPVYDLTGNTSVNDPDTYGLLSLDKRADYGNIHPYPAASRQPYNDLLSGLGSSYFSVTPSQAVITETGYVTAQISQRAQALYYLNIYLDAFQQGFKSTYIYELTDNSGETFGMYDTADKPKASATAIHNLTSVLADTGNAREGTLTYSLTGAAKTTHSFALQRSDGSFNLVVWDERPIWNGSDVTPSATSVTASLGRTFSSVKVYKPFGGTSVQQTASNASTIGLQLSGEPLVLSLTP